ncbi:MAG: hypothetical protein ACSLE0_07895 [Chitinophagaceae bacterium]
MKIPSLLAQYFYNHKRLDLPGIGSFIVESSSLRELQNSKQRSVVLDAVSFENNPSLKESPELISYISEKTGKMRALASSDLDSHLHLARQFLNMGKPFTFEGIGILSTIKPGELEFTPISVPVDKIRQNDPETSTLPETNEISSSRYESFLTGPGTKFEWKKPVIGLLLLAGVGITIWGGYIISRKNKNDIVNTDSRTVMPQTLVTDSLPPDDSVALVQTIAPPAENYKYVLEVASGKRAFKRYNQLKTIRWKIQMETNDSIRYKLFMMLPSIADTTRTLDSLTVMTGRKVYIEYQN